MRFRALPVVERGVVVQAGGTRVGGSGGGGGGGGEGFEFGETAVGAEEGGTMAEVRVFGVRGDCVDDVPAREYVSSPQLLP